MFNFKNYIFYHIIILHFIWPVGALGQPSDIIIGLDADMTSGSSRAGISIQRGAQIAIDELNTSGGILGRLLRIDVRDHKGNPARGVDNITEFSKVEDIVAVIGGLHSPVALHELPSIHEHKMIFLVPWAAGTRIVDNGYSPNFVFGVSIRDESAGTFLIQQSIKRGYRRMALVLEHTAWGRSNEQAMKLALKAVGLKPVAISWFHWSATNTAQIISEIEQAGPDVILLVANAPEGQAFVESMATNPKIRGIPVISHWGITGGNFFSDAREALRSIDLSFIQTFSFLDPPFPDRAKRVASAYLNRYSDVRNTRYIFAPVGVAHAYDLIHLFALAIQQAGTTERETVRDALENLPFYKGLVRNYMPAFTKMKHDALDAENYRLSEFDDDGAIIPLP